MPYITGPKNVEIYYEEFPADPGIQTLVFVHGTPLGCHSWYHQMSHFLGRRLITFDRRGWGKSGRPGDTPFPHPEDLDVLLTTLEVSDAVLIGFGEGTSEIVQYLSQRGSGRVSRIVLISAVPPCLRKSDDNPEGMSGGLLDKMQGAVDDDLFRYLEDFFDEYYNTDELLGRRISEAKVRSDVAAAAQASPWSYFWAAQATRVDFREDVRKIDVPTLVIHGTANRLLPIEATADRLPALIKDCRLVRIEGGPHGIIWTHRQEVNSAIADFLADGAPTDGRGTP
jgi:non-heme chloroperoxidase